MEQIKVEWENLNSGFQSLVILLELLACIALVLFSIYQAKREV